MLVVEDNPADVDFMQEALRETGSGSDLMVARTGEEAVAILAREGEHADKDAPDLVLLDLNLPGMSGRDVLAFIKKQPGLRRLPVIVLTSSAEQPDIDAAYEAHANGYVVKPLHFDGYVTLLREIEHFWGTRACRPRISPAARQRP